MTSGRLVRAWLPAILYMAAIFVVSSLQVRTPMIEAFPLRDKGVHVLEYAGLGLLLAHATLRTWPGHATWRVVAVAIVIGVGWGVLDEIHQALVPGRVTDLLDVAADVLGTTVGAVGRAVPRMVRAVQARDA